MENHYHFLVETPRANLAQILHHINGAYTNYYNTRRQRSGHLFQGRYKAILVEKDAYLQELSRYIHLNPVRAGLVERPSAYPWSSYCCYVGMKKRPDWLSTEDLLEYFGSNHAAAKTHYKMFVEAETGGEIRNPLKDVVGSTFLGKKEFIERMKMKVLSKKGLDPRNVPALRQIGNKPSFEEIADAVRSLVDERGVDFRKWCLLVCQEFGGYALNEIGNRYGMNGPAVSQSNRRLRARISREAVAKDIFTEIGTRLGVEC
jgi:hypothetical protein